MKIPGQSPLNSIHMKVHKACITHVYENVHTHMHIYAHAHVNTYIHTCTTPTKKGTKSPLKYCRNVNHHKNKQEQRELL